MVSQKTQDVTPGVKTWAINMGYDVYDNLFEQKQRDWWPRS